MGAAESKPKYPNYIRCPEGEFWCNGTCEGENREWHRQRSLNRVLYNAIWADDDKPDVQQCKRAIADGAKINCAHFDEIEIAQRSKQQGHHGDCQPPAIG